MTRFTSSVGNPSTAMYHASIRRSAAVANRRGRSPRFFDEGNRLLLALDDLARDHALADFLLSRQRVHQVEHEIFDDHPQPARADLARQRQLRNGFERVVGELELHVLVLEQLLVLTRDGVARLREDLHQRGFVELVQRADHRQAPDELGNQPVLDEVFRLHLFEGGADVAAGDRFHVRLEAERLLSGTTLDLLLESHERATADEENVGRVDLEELLVRVLASALRRDVRDRALEDFQQRLLDAFPRDVAGDRRVLVLAADLVDLVDIDDPLLALLDVAARRLQQLENDVLDVLADVAGFGQRRRVDDCEGDGEELGERLGEKRFAGAGRADEQDVRLGQLDVVARPRLLLDLDALVMVVDRDRQLLLRLFLADDVLVEELLDLLRDRQGGAGPAARLELVVVRDDVVADLDALVADEDGRTGDQFADVVLVLVTERAAENLAFAVLFHHVGLGPFADDVVNNTVFLPLLRAHDVVPFGVILDTLQGLTGVVRQYLVEALAGAQQLPGVNIDIRRLAAQALHPRLMNKDAGIGEGVPLPLGAGREQHGGHRRRLPDAVGRHVRLDELHRVVDRHAGRHDAARAVDVQQDVPIGVLGLQKQHLRDHQIGDVVVDGRADEDDAVLQQAREDVVCTLAAVGLFDHHRDQLGIRRMSHAKASARETKNVFASLVGSSGKVPILRL